MISSRTTIVTLLIVFLAIVVQNSNAYRLDQRQAHDENLGDISELSQPEFIAKLQKLIAAAEIMYGAHESKEVPSAEHDIHTRLAINRRPGLIRLKKSA